MFVVVYGGSASGKSEYAESLVTGWKDKGEETSPVRIYIATMYPFDEECRLRIGRHQRMRESKRFQTVECYTGLKRVQVPQGASVLLECMSNLTANERYLPDGAKEAAVSEILEGIGRLKKQAGLLVAVTNDVFCSGVSYDPDTMGYLEDLGKINAAMAAMADEVVEVVYTIPVRLKGGAV